MRGSVAVLCMAGALALAQSCARPQATGPADPYADAPPYLKRIPGDTTTMIWPILTTGQRIPLTGGRGEHRVVGLPDGLGLRRDGDRAILLSNHELTPSGGGPAGPLPSGARVSEFALSLEEDAGYTRARVRSGRWAIEQVYDSSGVRMPPGARRFAKFCSATLADERVGFDRPMFLTGEELGRDSTFDRLGGQSFAVFEGNARPLPRLGRFRRENQVPAPFTDSLTVVFCLEDNDDTTGTGLVSQLYMYVGRKRRDATDALGANGLDNGDLYVFAARDTSIGGEDEFAPGDRALAGRWARVDWRLDETRLESASQAANAFDMVRVEDGAAHPVRPGEFWFVTTGGARSRFNRFGRLYRLNFDVRDPAEGATTLTIVLGDGSGIVSPDNIDLNRHDELAICEDPNYNLCSLGLDRDTYFWIYDIRKDTLFRVAEIDRGAAREHAFKADRENPRSEKADHPGGWEISGVVDAEACLGRGAWVLDVQAHSLRIQPVPETVEGGQYLQVVWKPR